MMFKKTTRCNATHNPCLTNTHLQNKCLSDNLMYSWLLLKICTCKASITSAHKGVGSGVEGGQEVKLINGE